MPKISERIKETREALGMSQAELADKSKLTPAAISQLEKGTRNPSLKTLGQLADALEVPTNYLIGTKQSEEDLPAEAEMMFRGMKKLAEEDRQLMLNVYNMLKARKKGKEAKKKK